MDEVEGVLGVRVHIVRISMDVHQNVVSQIFNTCVLIKWGKG